MDKEDLKIVNKLKNKIGIGITTPEHQINIECKCGNKSYINTNFQINVIGMIQFECNECGKIMDSQYLYWKD